MKIIKNITLFVFLFSSLFFFSCTGSQRADEGSAGVQVSNLLTNNDFLNDDSSGNLTEDLSEPLHSASGSSYINIVAVGDNLVHHPIFEASLVDDGTYSFHYIFDHIRDYIIPADIAFINQETIFGNETLGYSGYPRFSTPSEMGTAVIAAGFNILNFANNHALDRGEEGIRSSIAYIENYEDVFYLGIHRSREERDTRQVILEINDVKIGFLAYSFSTNGIPFPAGRSFLVSLIDRDIMRAEINAIRPNCDFLIVSMHWGDEYALNYNRRQEDLAHFLAELQVDLVIGHHPHVLQPMDIIDRPDGDQMPVFYSLGNFLSSHARTTKEALLGGIMYVRLAVSNVSGTPEINIEDIGLIPIITHFDVNRNNFGIYPLHDYTDDLASLHWRRLSMGGDPDMNVDFFENMAMEMFGPVLVQRNIFQD